MAGIRDRYGDLVNILSNCLPHLAGVVSKARYCFTSGGLRVLLEGEELLHLKSNAFYRIILLICNVFFFFFFFKDILIYINLQKKIGSSYCLSVMHNSFCLSCIVKLSIHFRLSFWITFLSFLP